MPSGVRLPAYNGEPPPKLKGVIVASGKATQGETVRTPPPPTEAAT